MEPKDPKSAPLTITNPSQDATEEKDSLQYEDCDFPVMVLSEGIYIDWYSYEAKTAVAERIREQGGVYIAEKDMDTFIQDFEILKDIHDYPDAELRWHQHSTKGLFLHTVIADAGKGLWLEVELDNPKSYSKVSTHNMQFAHQGIFFTQCIAAYLEHAAKIEIPHIRTRIISREDKKLLLYEEAGKKVYHCYKKNECKYSFRLPVDPNTSIPMLSSLAAQYGLQEKVLVTEDGILWNGKLCVPFSQDKSFFVAQDIDNLSVAIRLFHLLSQPLKRKIWR